MKKSKKHSSADKTSVPLIIVSPVDIDPAPARSFIIESLTNKSPIAFGSVVNYRNIPTLALTSVFNAKTQKHQAMALSAALDIALKRAAEQGVEVKRVALSMVIYDDTGFRVGSMNMSDDDTSDPMSDDEIASLNIRIQRDIGVESAVDVSNCVHNSQFQSFMNSTLKPLDTL